MNMDKAQEHTKKQLPKGMKPWPKGVSGNPGGRPKGTSVSTLIRKLLEKIEPHSKKTYKELMAEAIVKGGIKKAIAGDGRLAEIVLERTEGKVKQMIDASLSGETKVVVFEPDESNK